MRAALVEDQVARAAPLRSWNVEQAFQTQFPVEPAVAERTDGTVEQPQDMDAIRAQVDSQQ